MNVIPFIFTTQSKLQVVQSLALALEREEFQWLPDEIGTAELLAYESKISKVTGHVSYSAPDGCNDDTVIARALLRRLAGIEPTGVLKW